MPKSILKLGTSQKTITELDNFIKRLHRRQLYLSDSYDLFNYNCLTFSNILCNYLCRCDIPDKYLKTIERLRKLKIPKPVGRFLMGTSRQRNNNSDDKDAKVLKTLRDDLFADQ